jgi:L-fuconolactonase
MSPWKEDIKKLASCENVSCKISGMVTEADWHNWTVKDFKPYMDVVLEAFSVERLTIGSDWPVCTLAGEYNSVISIVADFITQLSDNEQKAIWEGNPVKIYGL